MDPDSAPFLTLPLSCRFSTYSLTGARGLYHEAPCYSAPARHRIPASPSPGEMGLYSSLPSQDWSQALLRASVCPSEKWGQVSLLEGLLWGFKEKCREWVCNLGSIDAAAS